MTNKEAIEIFESWLTDSQYIFEHKWTMAQMQDACRVAIGSIRRDSKVDDITFHWNDKNHSFVAACIAFEAILNVYDRGVTE